MNQSGSPHDTPIGPPPPCIICGREFTTENTPCGEQCLADDGKTVGVLLYPSGGTVFHTQGHYGSTFWDSFTGERIDVTICDACLTERVKHLRFLRRVKDWPMIVERFTPAWVAKLIGRQQPNVIDNAIQEGVQRHYRIMDEEGRTP